MNKNEKFVITINRELGSGGRTIGRKLSERLGVTFYDKAVIKALQKKFRLSIDEIERLKGQNHSWWAELKRALWRDESYSMPYYQATMVDYNDVPTSFRMFETEEEILTGIAEEESCVVAGRTGFMVFREWPNHLNVFIQASMAYRIQRVMRRQKVSEQEARDIIAKMDATREAYIKKYEDTSRYDTRNYQLVISMDDLSEDDAAEIILDYIDRTSK
jgi:cytidylate kinase